MSMSVPNVCSYVSCVVVMTMKRSCCSVICVIAAITLTASRSAADLLTCFISRHMFEHQYFTGTSMFTDVLAVQQAVMSVLQFVNSGVNVVLYSRNLTAFQMVTGIATSAYLRSAQPLFL